ncbi:hypothetical protein D3H65_16415 [Paraflavitalea soli]|uniref:Uncharacterized protein n=1 Tax=Paraflavitalea soli TaxID=2315862 RepID=A0A3B7MR71_9BACT|nr:hypothetical protein [Paraflavitalea soli]AXY75466.1 hypothetical protein D3H65_16415 [Paraflavitalea soli]
MERLQQLIGKLNEQFEQNADNKQLLVTTQLIEAELMRLSAATRAAQGTSKVAVVMPAARTVYNTVVVETPVLEAKVAEEIVLPVEKQEEKPARNGNGTHAPAAAVQAGLQFNPLVEIPTLAHQTSAKELNETMATAQASLNDKLKEERVEVGHRLNDSPVRDLKKAIGINDRFVFINDLFRGDEVMYERSVKTINGFRIYPEAQYWIERELKIKLGWDDSKEITRHFYQLVKRRFS